MPTHQSVQTDSGNGLASGSRGPASPAQISAPISVAMTQLGPNRQSAPPAARRGQIRRGRNHAATKRAGRIASRTTVSATLAVPAAI